MVSSVRVRYAPSPTGEPHLGNIRTALFNWLFARSQGGAFIVRIEDTDQARKVDGATDAILEALRWLGIDWDEGPEVGGSYGPYVQSERVEIYQEHAQRLVDEGKAYCCYCTPERLDAMRKEQQAQKRPPGYDRRCRDLTPESAAKASEENPRPVVRFRMPLEGAIVVSDAIRGDVEFEASLLDDFVILKSDGFPTYHLANVVDDHLMEISHVMRAEEWLPSAPRHKELYKALGYELPLLVHLPMILGPDKAKLSKRHGATSALEYRNLGYLPDAMINFMSLLGWSLDDHTDVISRETLMQNFALERVASSPAVFNVEKLDWFNGLYIRALPPDDLTGLLMPWLERGLPDDVERPIDREYARRIVPLEQERLKRLADVSEAMAFFFVEQPKYNPLRVIQKGMVRDDTRAALGAAIETLESVETWTAETLEPMLRALADRLELKAGQLFGALRVALTGQTAAPPLFDTMEVLGKERCMARLRSADFFVNAIPIAC
jgi:glutamyl-tRNA synthetase